MGNFKQSLTKGVKDLIKLDIWTEVILVLCLNIVSNPPSAIFGFMMALLIVLRIFRVGIIPNVRDKTEEVVNNNVKNVTKFTGKLEFLIRVLKAKFKKKVNGLIGTL